MPTTAEHLTKAVSNDGFAENLRPSNPTSVGWTLTALFYSVFHYVEAISDNTKDLNNDLRKNSLMDAIHDDFMDLSNYSSKRRIQHYKVRPGTVERSHGSLVEAIRKRTTGLL